MMRWLVIILFACLALTVLRATIAVLLVLLALSVTWGVFFRPTETYGFFALMAFMSILERYPLPVLLLIGLLAIITLVGSRDKEEPAGECRPPGYLPPPDTDATDS